MPTRREWEKELGCFGYMGFGGGYAAVVEDKAAPGYGIYCNVCPVQKGCWQEHRRRTLELFPELQAEWNRTLERHGMDGRKASADWFRRMQCAPPDLAVEGGNMEDGMAIAHGAKKPKDRGPGRTLTWPLTPRKVAS